MEPTAPPAANQATTASADFFVVPPVRQTYATGFGARAVPKMGRRRKQRKWRKSALAYLLQRPEPPPPRRATPPPPTPTDVSFLIWPVRQRWSRPFYDFPPTATHFVAAPFDMLDFFATTRKTLRIRAELRAERLGDGPPARGAEAAALRPRRRQRRRRRHGRHDAFRPLDAHGRGPGDGGVLVCDNRRIGLRSTCAALGCLRCPTRLAAARTARSGGGQGRALPGVGGGRRPNSVLLCDRCDGDAHLECAGLAAVPAPKKNSRAPFARGGPCGGLRGRRGRRKRRRRRRADDRRERRRPSSARRSRRGGPSSSSPTATGRVAAALEGRAGACRAGDRAPHRATTPGPRFLQMGRPSGKARGWFPGAVRSPRPTEGSHFEMVPQPAPAGPPIPKAFRPRRGGRRRDACSPWTITAASGSGSRTNAWRARTWLAAEDVASAITTPPAAIGVARAARRGHDAQLGLVTRGGKDGVGADTARWPYLRGCCSATLRLGAGDARCSSVYVATTATAATTVGREISTRTTTTSRRRG